MTTQFNFSDHDDAIAQDIIFAPHTFTDLTLLYCDSPVSIILIVVTAHD